MIKLKKFGFGKRVVREEDVALMTSGEVKCIEVKVCKFCVYDCEKEMFVCFVVFNLN